MVSVTRRNEVPVDANTVSDIANRHGLRVDGFSELDSSGMINTIYALGDDLGRHRYSEDEPFTRFVAEMWRWTITGEGYDSPTP